MKTTLTSSAIVAATTLTTPLNTTPKAKIIASLTAKLAGVALISLCTSTLAISPVYADQADSKTSTQQASKSAFQVNITGQGKPMILIPGLASSGAVWDDTVAHYSGQYRCIVLTLSGFAGAPATDGPLIKQAEEQLANYIITNKLQQPVIVGHSLGGFLALKLASDYPAAVGKVVIVDSLPALGATQMPSITTPQLEEMASNMRNSMLHSDDASRATMRRQAAVSMVSKPADVERVISWSEKSDQTAVANAMYEMMSQDMRQDISKIKAPTLVLGTWIAYRDYAPRSAIENTFKTQYAQLPQAKIELADNARHFMMFDDPQWMFDRMDSFLK
ncbi:pimeloyl-ACP methyl ester carboxylesterase [Undibacterium sp. GrIS 1.8]|uniref:alpha/beta fold hydrolase n=1 Tax=Undibacterium sp. GrIS 1.8 TaxID=3143934 RepID=UPI0033929FA4